MHFKMCNGSPRVDLHLGAFLKHVVALGEYEFTLKNYFGNFVKHVMLRQDCDLHLESKDKCF